jgi:hypothetical protein
MSWNTDAAIFPCFRTLNLYNLLGLQAEIWQLQEELDGFIKANDSQEIGLEKNLYSVDWQLLQEKEENEKKGQLSTIVKLRGKLWEYSMYLRLYPKINVWSGSGNLKPSLYEWISPSAPVLNNVSTDLNRHSSSPSARPLPTALP